MKRLLLAALLSLFTAASAFAQESAATPERPKNPAVIEIDVTLAQWNGEAHKEPGLAGTTEEVVERVKKLEKDGALTVIQRFRITTVDGQAALAQQGENRPRVVGTSGGARGGFASQISYSATGTMVSVTPAIAEDGKAILTLSVERSAIVQRADAPVLGEAPGGEKTKADTTTTLRLSSTLRIASGQTALLAGVASNDERQVALVSVKVVK